MSKRTIGSDDSIPSLAAKRGLFWETVWNHPENAELKQKRKSPNQLASGDQVFLPKPEEKWLPVDTDSTAEFVRKGIPAKFRVQLKRLGKPRPDEPFVLEIGEERIEGSTDGEGVIEEFLPPGAKAGTLILKDGKERHALRFSRLDPVEELTGVQQRLNNLGFRCGREDGELGEGTAAALRAFQSAHELEETGEADAATIAKLGEVYG